MDFLLKSVNEVQSLDWSASHYEVWIKVFSVLLVLQSEDCGSGIDLSLLSNIVQRLTDEENLMHVWKEIILKPKCATSRDCFEVLNGFRVIANVYKDNVPASLTMREYSCAMMRALARCVACTKKSGNGETIAMILSLLSNSNLKYFLMELTQNPDSELSNIFAAANPIWCLNAASICIKAMEESDVTGWSAFERVFKALMQKVSEKGIPISEVLEALVFNKAAPISTYGATLIISTFTVVELPEVLDTVGLVWGDRQFVSRADDKKQLLYTRILLAALTRCERRHLQANGSRNLPVELVLTMGVSNYLEIENIRIRQYGMKVAVAYSKLLGQELHFAELEAIERAEEERNTQLSANPGVAQVEAQAQVQVGGTTAGASAGERKHSSGMSAQVTGGGETGTGRRGSAQPQSAGYDSDGDSDSSVELEGYAIDEGAGAQGSGSVYSYKDKLLRTNYLRDCLQMLRCPESKPEARQQLQAALDRIPVIMASDPPDALDLCLPLMKDLLTVSNNFNIEKFHEKRAEAVQSVLHRNPATAVPFLTSSLLGTDLPLGLKFLVLEWLMTSAKELSNIPTDATNPPMPLSLQAPVAAGVVGAVGESSTEDMIPGGARLGKTTIKRPAKLAQSKQRTKYFRNNFGPLSHLYFYPLMALLGKMWNNKLNEQTAAVAHSADKFNLISEMFEPQPPASGRNDKAHAGNQEKGKMLASHANLSHLDGVDALLPAQCLVALGVFTQCALNTVAQRDHALQVITVASAFRSATAVGVRRASLYALRLAFEAYLPASATAAAVSSSTGNHPASRALSQQQARLSARRGPLDTLLHLSGEDALLGVDAGGDIAGDGTSAVSSEAVAMSIMSQPAVVDTVDWAASSWKDDPDEVSRTLKHEIVSMAVRVLS